MPGTVGGILRESHHDHGRRRVIEGLPVLLEA